MWVQRSTIKDCVKKWDSGIETMQYNLVFLASDYTDDITATVLVGKYKWAIFKTVLPRKIIGLTLQN
jgi:hypothetical protein